MSSSDAPAAAADLAGLARPLTPPPRRACLAALATLATLAIGGCGFELRRPPRLSFGSIALEGFAPRSPLAEELRRHLTQQVRVLDTPAKAEVVLRSLLDVRERSVVASTSAAQVREMQLRLKFHFRAHTPGGRELIPRVELLLSRDLSYSETFALAKEYEEAELFREMQADLVSQVLRRLAAVGV
ncbi:LPS assembly lipoprotein LptE [Brevundimonas sp.]|uniref:LPS-assembly lipoprotein LptE n=1 Tax=Brevundimonas sp. TaxID=1871086 RepID=UPI00272F67C1|nr:LPS assembly lipoprotein LptE [Brevundimonas sp.]MDP1912244.1 LPS assembly lipoprotein LptE [Brevundimonas sp.]